MGYPGQAEYRPPRSKKIMATSFKMSHAYTDTLSAPNPAVVHCQPTPPPQTPGHSQASLGQSPVGSLLLSPGTWCAQGFVCALQESVSPVLCKFQSPCPCSRPLLTHPSTGHTQTLKGMSGSVSVGSPGVHKVFCEPSKSLWWVWGLILNMISSLLPSCWGFSFALGRGVSFSGGIKHSPVNGCSSASCNFGVLTGEEEHTSFYSAILRHILILACNSSSPAFLMYSAYRLNK